MFDVPVLEVTASSAPVITVYGVSQVSEIGLSKISADLLNVIATSSQPADAPSTTMGEVTSSADNATTKTLLPHGEFQVLEPLNLADAATSLENILTLSMDTAAPSPQSAVETLGAAVSTPESPKAKLETAQSSIDDITLPPGAAALAKAPAVTMRKELSQCIDIKKPDDMTQMHTLFQVVLRGDIIGELSSTRGIEHVAKTLQEMLVDESLNPNDITPVFLEDGQFAIRLSGDVLVKIVSQVRVASTVELPERSTEWVAITWSDQLRRTMGAAPLDAGDIQMMLKGLHPSEHELNGLASWYGPYFHGRRTANGEIFDQHTLTAAHQSLPFNTVLKVRNLKNDRTVVVRINDRGPYIGKRSLDLSQAAAQCLDSEKTGVVPYEAVILAPS